MDQQEQNDDEQIRSEQFNMRLLEFLVHNPHYWNINEITGMASKKTLNYNRVKKSIIYFANKEFVKKFSDLSINEQQIERNNTNREMNAESYKITENGENVFTKITTSCLDPISQRLLSLKKIE